MLKGTLGVKKWCQEVLTKRQCDTLGWERVADFPFCVAPGASSSLTVCFQYKESLFLFSLCPISHLQSSVPSVLCVLNPFALFCSVSGFPLHLWNTAFVCTSAYMLSWKPNYLFSSRWCPAFRSNTCFALSQSWEFLSVFLKTVFGSVCNFDSRERELFRHGSATEKARGSQKSVVFICWVTYRTCLCVKQVPIQLIVVFLF